MQVNRRGVLLGGLGAALLGRPAAAQDITFFRIGTGGTIGTHCPVGGLIANAISNPPGSRTCADGGSCGVPNLIAAAVPLGIPNARFFADGNPKAMIEEGTLALQREMSELTCAQPPASGRLSISLGDRPPDGLLYHEHDAPRAFNHVAAAEAPGVVGKADRKSVV